MNTLFQAMNKTASTDNGALAHHSSLSANLDFFYLAGASRGKDIKKEFKLALYEDVEIALRTLQWLRDIRGGAGERQLFKDLFTVMDNASNATKVLPKIKEIGRLDDLLDISQMLAGTSPLGDTIAAQALTLFCNDLKANNGLAFKWTPIKGATAKKLRKLMGFKKEVDWRKFVVAGRKTVEQQMCAKEWSEINFSHVPSVASARYQKAFGRNASKEYGEYLESLKKGDSGVKINASAVYPVDVLKSCINGDPAIAEQQWKALPNYLEGCQERILPMIDVSGSMDCPAGGSGSMTCMQVAISLGWYLADRIEGTFNKTFMTFESVPKLLQLQKEATLESTFGAISQVPWGGSTNIQMAFKVLLEAAKRYPVPKDEMPTTIIILSDMQFDSSCVHGSDVTAFDMIRAEYAASGYELPKLVFWNLNASNKTIPVTKHQTGTVMVSGYSPSIMKGILKGGLTPEQVMLDTVMIERYKL